MSRPKGRVGLGLRLLAPVPAVLAAVVTLSQAPPAQAQSTIGFEVPSVVDPIHLYGEPVSDRQWYAKFDPPSNVNSVSPYGGQTPLLYFVYNGTTEWSKSTDGLTWTPALTDAQGPGGCLNPTCTPAFGPDGVPAVD